MSAVTLDDVKSKIRELAAAAPDNKYRGKKCLYTQGLCSNGAYGCIVGQALSALGYHTQLKAQDMDGPIEASSVLAMLGFGECVWIDRVQIAQDTGSTWSQAVSLADNYRTYYEEHEYEDF